MTAKFEVSTGINTQTINGYPSDSTLCLIEGNDGLVAHIFVEHEGKVVISTNMPEVIDIRHEEVRKCLPKWDYHLLPKATEQRKTLKMNHCIHLEQPNVSGYFSNDNGSVMYPHAPLDKPCMK
ncbi:hypothetical protein [Klebsiella quasipneumoniae]|uniref:hypothetical protein n=1 Tax=Klebsiella quasipneumoniae TaxID=1463165 RepID=UPI00109C4140|nr:hypothetical protein [Klebsiella quasipneumoniae]MBC4928105.1 hypothetical protein [Klebsiella quasipneumoniae]UDC56703.1 hypothetical protein LGM24_09495 [Klebsiella quasipneumoniae subsp. quasipneumoniae]VGP63790.1 hypothetical protein SB02110_05533 [Klebsiella quasipneumoniae subsp. quasipneumoniae]